MLSAWARGLYRRLRHLFIVGTAPRPWLIKTYLLYTVYGIVESLIAIISSSFIMLIYYADYWASWPLLSLNLIIIITISYTCCQPNHYTAILLNSDTSVNAGHLGASLSERRILSNFTLRRGCKNSCHAIAPSTKCLLYAVTVCQQLATSPGPSQCVGRGLGRG